MSLEAWVKTLRRATDVTDVQPTIHEGYMRNVICTGGVTDVTTHNTIAANDTSLTFPNVETLHAKVPDSLACTAVTSVTAEKVEEVELAPFDWMFNANCPEDNFSSFDFQIQPFIDWGLERSEAEELSKKLSERDTQSLKGMHSCVECKYLVIANGWFCKNWRQANVSYCANQTELARDFVCLLQWCDGFELHPDLQAIQTDDGYPT